MNHPEKRCEPWLKRRRSSPSNHLADAVGRFIASDAGEITSLEAPYTMYPVPGSIDVRDGRGLAGGETGKGRLGREVGRDKGTAKRLQPLGSRAKDRKLERETGFEPATSTLARSHSTTELLPLVASFYSTCIFADNSPTWIDSKRRRAPFLVANPLQQSGIVSGCLSA